MSNKSDGGPAFPCDGPEILNARHSGMSLRDWFAGMAMQRLLIVAGDAISKMDAADLQELLARKSFEMADARIAEREK
jgi:hypothetical protein